MSVSYRNLRRTIVSGVLASGLVVAGSSMSTAQSSSTDSETFQTVLSKQAASKPSIRAWIGSAQCASKGKAYVNIAVTNTSRVNGGVTFRVYRNGTLVRSIWLSSDRTAANGTYSTRQSMKIASNQSLTIYRKLDSKRKKLLAKKTGISTTKCR